jgi:2-desacetyl-2-hydroxyethyl bacteriochlorophyllide A dehydrogenase
LSSESHETASALWIIGPGRAEIRPAAAPSPPAGNLRIRALVSGISRGTESLVFAGKIPESEWQRMRCPFQEGDFPFPVKYGYALAGVVEAGPAERIGGRVFCLHPHQSRLTIPAEAALAIPAGVSIERAVLAPQMETALNATWDAGPRIGDRIAVVGAGTIGCLVAYLCRRLHGSAVTLIDTNEDRRQVATALGLDFATPSDTPPGGCDLVFHASGQAAGLDLSLSLAGFEATVIELSWYGTTPVSVNLGGAFHSQRLTLRASQVGSVARKRRSRWSTQRRLALAMDLAADPRLDVLVGSESPFETLPAALPAILGMPGALCHLVRYPQS